MPCKDLTELIRIVVNDADELVDYRFVKRTCGQGVGADALLLAQLQGMRVPELLAWTPQDFLAAHPVPEGIEEFLTLKHLIAVQSALEVLTGAAAGDSEAICAAADISYADGETVLEGRITLDLVTEKIRSCGGCKGCGKKSAPVAELFA